jgi:hypothetical protein
VVPGTEFTPSVVAHTAYNQQCPLYKKLYTESGLPVVLDDPIMAPEEVTYKKVNAKAGKSVYETRLFSMDLYLSLN